MNIYTQDKTDEFLSMTKIQLLTFGLKWKQCFVSQNGVSKCFKAGIPTLSSAAR